MPKALTATFATRRGRFIGLEGGVEASSPSTSPSGAGQLFGLDDGGGIYTIEQRPRLVRIHGDPTAASAVDINDRGHDRGPHILGCRARSTAPAGRDRFTRSTSPVPCRPGPSHQQPRSDRGRDDDTDDRFHGTCRDDRAVHDVRRARRRRTSCPRHQRPRRDRWPLLLRRSRRPSDRPRGPRRLPAEQRGSTPLRRPGRRRSPCPLASTTAGRSWSPRPPVASRRPGLPAAQGCRGALHPHRPLRRPARPEPCWPPASMTEGRSSASTRTPMPRRIVSRAPCGCRR